MAHEVVILGAGFGGLELARSLSDAGADDVHIVLIDQSDTFTFGFAKLDVLFARATAPQVRLPYRDVEMRGVEFRQERVTRIEPSRRRV